jgi:glycosyltransferase involved in cell wall biosynthesis
LTTALLIFERDEVDRTTSTLAVSGHYFDETVVIDSSSQENYQKLANTVSSGTRIYRVPPLGYPDPLRLYALTKIKSDYVLIIDADETLTDDLGRDLAKLNKLDGYWVPRIEEPNQRTTYQMRLFMRDKYLFDGYIHGRPYVSGRIGRLPKTHALIHHMVTNHLQKRSERYLELELFEHPEPRIVGRLLSKIPRALPPVVIPFFYLRDMVVMFPRMVASESEGARTLLWYLAAKYIYAYSQQPGRLDLAVSISRQIRLAGGPIKYLGLDDPEFVESLGQISKERSELGVSLFIDLLIRRYAGQTESSIVGDR